MEEQQTKQCFVGDKLFVGGDVSGIQKFIYNISSRKAAVSLKGRSNYLRKKTEKVCDDILLLPSIQHPDKVYCSGGKFYLIVDNTEAIRQELDKYILSVSQEFWTTHQGQLAMNISYVDFSFNDDGTINMPEKERANIGLLWKRMTEDFTRLKAQKFKDVILNNYDSFFEVRPVGGNTKVCAITGIESPDCVQLEPEADEQESIWVLPVVREQVIYGRKLREKEHTRTFEEYAEDTYLGILRMDIDGLGARFIRGFQNIEAYRSFSNYLQEYFDTNLWALREKTDYVNDLNIIYAGGDDIFVVGKWNVVFDFAAEVRNDFCHYVDKYPKNEPNSTPIRLSGGMAIVSRKFPIAKAAEMAGEAEDKAKHFERLVNGNILKKNAFCIFDETFCWDEEYDYIKKHKEILCDLIEEKNGLSRGILHKLMLYALMIKGNKNRKSRGKSENFTYMWHSTYYLTRLLGRYNSKDAKNAAICEYVKSLRDKEMVGSNRNIELLAIAARWAELELRIKNK